MIVNIKNDDGYDVLLNLDNMLYCRVYQQGGYQLVFNNGEYFILSWKMYERLVKAIEIHGR